MMFLFSGISKLISLPFFDAMVAELFLGTNYYDFPKSMFYTQLLSRVLISAELVLGVAMLQDRWFKKIALPGLQLMLLVFTIHLFYEGLTSDKGFIEGNCGCFGDVLPMNNLESIIKNIVAMTIGVFVWKGYKNEHRMASWIPPVVLGAVTMMTLSFTIKTYQSVDKSEVDSLVESPSFVMSSDSTIGIDSMYVEGENGDWEWIGGKSEVQDTTKSSDNMTEVDVQSIKAQTPPEKEQANTTLNMLTALGTFSDGAKLDVSQGQHLVCLFSMTCGHCQDSYKEMCEMGEYASASLPKIHLINYGKEFEQQYFFNQAGDCSHRFFRTEDYTQFNRLLQGKGFPRMIAYKNGKVVADWDIDSYNKDVFMKFYQIEEKKAASDGLNLKKKDDSFDDEFSTDPWK